MGLVLMTWTFLLGQMPLARLMLSFLPKAGLISHITQEFLLNIPSTDKSSWHLANPCCMCLTLSVSSAGMLGAEPTLMHSWWVWKGCDAGGGTKEEYPRGCKPALRPGGRSHEGWKQWEQGMVGWKGKPGERPSAPRYGACFPDKFNPKQKRNDEMKKASASCVKRALSGWHCFTVQTAWLIGFPNNISQCLSVRGPWEQ